MIRKLTLFALVALLLTGCKYQDGPLLSLRSKEKRVVNTWSFDVVTNADGTDATANFAGWTVALHESGSLFIHWKFLGADHDDTGSWEFADRKESIHLTYGNTTLQTMFPKQFLITKLKNKNMIIKSNANVIYNLTSD